MAEAHGLGFHLEDQKLQDSCTCSWLFYKCVSAFPASEKVKLKDNTIRGFYRRGFLRHPPVQLAHGSTSTTTSMISMTNGGEFVCTYQIFLDLQIAKLE